MHNKIEHNFHLSNKKALFYNLKSFYEATCKEIFDIVPITFHIKDSDDINFAEFQTTFKLFEDFTDKQGKKLANL